MAIRSTGRTLNRIAKIKESHIHAHGKRNGPPSTNVITWKLPKKVEKSKPGSIRKNYGMYKSTQRALNLRDRLAGKS